MEKAYILATKYGAFGIFLLIITVAVSFDFKADDIEGFGQMNEWKIKMLGIVVVATISGFIHFWISFQLQLKEKKTIIEFQNKTIIEHNLRFISSLDKVTIALNKNSARDNETIKKLNQLAHIVDKLETRMETSEKQLSRHDDFIRNLKIRNATG